MITSLRQEARSLKQSSDVTVDAANRLLINNAPAGIYRSSPDGRLLLANSAFASILGYDSAEEAAERLYPLASTLYVDPHRRDEFKRRLENYGVVHSMEIEAYRKDRQVIWISVDARLVRDSRGRTQYYEGFIKDVTALRRKEEEREGYIQGLININRNLKELAHMISHELREPLRAATCFIELAKRGEASPMDKQAAGYIDESLSMLRRMHDLIGSLVRFSADENICDRWQTTSIDQVLTDVAKELSVSFVQKQAVLRRCLLPDVECDPTLIYEVFLNLIGNALKYGQEGRSLEISVSYRLEGAKHIFDIADNGSGFDMRFAEQIFEPFRRLHNDGRGSGMGLTICKRIIERHGGRIWARSIAQQGSTFSFFLPKTADTRE